MFRVVKPRNEKSSAPEVDQDSREQERPEKLPPFDSKLARLARVVHGEPLRQAARRLVLEEFERFVERDARRDDALDANGVQLLKPLQLPRLGGVLERREGRKRNQLSAGPGDVDLLELVRRQAFRALDLGDDLVTAPLY